MITVLQVVSNEVKVEVLNEVEVEASNESLA